MVHPKQRIGLIPMLRALPAAERAKLVDVAVVRSLKRGEVIWADGAPCKTFTFVLRGHAKPCRPTRSGRTAISAIKRPGEVLCAGIACAGAPYCCTSAALADDMLIAEVNRETLLEAVGRQPEAVPLLLEELSREALTRCARIEELSTGRVEQRVAAALLQLALDTGIEQGAELLVPIALSRQDIASLCGTTLESAIRTVRRFEELLLLRPVAGGFVVTNRSGLADMAAGSAYPNQPDD